MSAERFRNDQSAFVRPEQIPPLGTVRGVSRAIYTLRRNPPHQKLQPEVMKRMQQLQPLHPSVAQTVEDIGQVATQLVDTSKVRSVRLRELARLGGVLINYTDYSPTLQAYAQTPYATIKSLYDGAIELAAQKEQPLTFADQLHVSLEQTKGDLPEALWQLFLTSRIFGRWLDGKSISNLPQLSTEAKIDMMHNWQKSLAACKEGEDKLAQDIGGDTYYVWTHALAVVAFTNLPQRPNPMTKWALQKFEKGADIMHAYTGDRAPQRSDHSKAQEYGNAIGQVCSKILTTSLR